MGMVAASYPREGVSGLRSKRTPKRKPPAVTAYFSDEREWDKVQKFLHRYAHISDSAFGRAWILDMIERAEKVGIDAVTLLPRQH